MAQAPTVGVKAASEAREVSQGGASFISKPAARPDRTIARASAVTAPAKTAAHDTADCVSFTVTAGAAKRSWSMCRLLPRVQK